MKISIQLDQAELNATTFVRAKGRLPEHFPELIRWLLEFDAYQTEILRLTYKAYVEHMNLCNRPLFNALNSPKT